jgi:hypothetical protein
MPRGAPSRLPARAGGSAVRRPPPPQATPPPQAQQHQLPPPPHHPPPPAADDAAQPPPPEMPPPADFDEMPPPPEEAPPDDDALDAIYAPPPDFPPPEDEQDAFAAQMARNARAKWQQEYARIPSGLLGGLPPPPAAAAAAAANNNNKPPPPGAIHQQQQQQPQQQQPQQPQQPPSQQQPAGRAAVAKQGSFAVSPGAAASSAGSSPQALSSQGSTNRRGLSKTRAQPSLALPVGGGGGGGAAEPSPRCDPVDALLLARHDGRQRTAYADARAALLARPLMGARGNSTLPETVPMRRMPLPYAVEPRLRALLSVGEVRFELGVIEPFYMTFAIHDRRRGLKLTEEFACDSHNDAVLQLIGGGQGNVDVRTRCRQAMFSLDPALAGSRDLVLIMRMSKQLNNEVEKDQAPYLDPKKSKANNTAALAQEAALLCRNPQPWKYRQPFAWSFRSLFLPNGEIDQRPARLDMYVARAGALADEQLYELIDNIPLLKKQKTIPGHVDTEVFDVTAKFEKIKGRVDAAMVPVGPRASDGQVVRHILEFGGDSAALSVAYQALLYIYPDQMHVSVKQKEMNVQVRVSCDHTGDDPEAAAKFFCKHDLQVRTAEEVSLVQRKEKKPQLVSEMKMMLPAVLTATSALRFTFHNIDIKGGAYKPAPFAFAVLPLFRDGRLIENGEHVLQLTEDMPTGDSEVIGHKGRAEEDDVLAAHRGRVDGAHSGRAVQQLLPRQRAPHWRRAAHRAADDHAAVSGARVAPRADALLAGGAAAAGVWRRGVRPAWCTCCRRSTSSSSRATTSATRPPASRRR